MNRSDVLRAATIIRESSKDYPHRKVDWHVVVPGGEDLPLRQLYSFVALKEISSISNDEARRVLESLGFDVVNKHMLQWRRSASRFWWVNHKQTYKAELEGGYIWSPKNKSNGHPHQSYTNLTLINPGDVVISYAGAEIRAIGVATAVCQEQPKPEAFGQAGEGWSDMGWLVPIEWTVLGTPILPKDHLAEITPRLPAKHSPLQPNGNGNQSCYLASVSAELGELIFNLAATSDLATVERVQELEDQLKADAVEQEIKDDKFLSETERDQLVRSRVGQGTFRLRVQKIETVCRLTGVADERFLIASHIKPWKDCTNEERLDGHNGLMLAPHVDKLFDRGWISFEDNGDLLVAADIPSAVMSAWGFSTGMNTGPFSAKQKVYLTHHRIEVLRRSK